MDADRNASAQTPSSDRRAGVSPDTVRSYRLDSSFHPRPGLVSDPETGPADPLWTAKQDSISLPGQVGLPGLRHSIGLARWHRLIPTSWDVFPNALSTLVQCGGLLVV